MANNFKYTDAQIKALLDGIFDGSITAYDIPEALYFATADYLKKGVYEGFGGTLVDFDGDNLALLKNLRENVYMFSAAKSHQQVREIQSLMFDEEGKKITINQFSKLGERTFETWNDAWGRSEYNTASHSASVAAQWQEIELNKDLLPILGYQTIGDTCDICRPLDGIKAPVDSPIWRDITPPNHFNCLCVLTQHEQGTRTTLASKLDTQVGSATKQMDDVFKMNPGVDNYIFSPEHPYFKVEKKDVPFAKTNFGLPIPDKD